MLKLVIGNKRYSSWSLRPWLLLSHFEIPFEEILVPLDQADTHQNILQYSPSGRVPALIDADTAVWESMAIAEYLNEKFPALQMWPKPSAARALAGSIANEMHSGFAALRNHLPHDLCETHPGFDIGPAHSKVYSEVYSDVQRIQQIWNQALKLSGGPYLFGNFSIADAMFAPVVNRFVTYDVALDDLSRGYVQTLRTLPAHQLWIAQAQQEKLRMPRYEKR